MKQAYRWTVLLGLSLLSACGGGGGNSAGGSSPPPAYTVSGSVTGLTASGLVLLDNGGDTTTVAANTTMFTFPTALGSGIAYAVSVHSQPTGETCVVTNGSGTIGSANVTGISVTCTVASYIVGGSVAGLGATGLVLLDNGADALAVAANATTFAFAKPVASASGYAVTVKTQPNGYTCAITDGSGTIGSANISTVSVTCTVSGPNVVSVNVGPGPADPTSQTFNIPLVSVKVCVHGTTTCATIDNVLVDTGSSGLRLLATAVAAANNGSGLTLPAEHDPAVPANTISECLPFADGYSWGSVVTADVSVGGESTAAAVPVQIIDGSATVPTSCSNGLSGPLNSVDDFDANGILGIGTSNQDCGSLCTSGAPPPNVYYSCPSGGCLSTASATTLELAAQVANPVASFLTDNNGAILQLPAIPAAGAATATGYLVFGIGTEANNGLGAATILTADPSGNFTTTYDSPTLGSQLFSKSFIDSGSNGLYFSDSSITSCLHTPPLDTADFYCPTSTLNLSATNEGLNGLPSMVSFQIADLATISSNNFAIDNVGGTYTAGSFDWGLPFFYGRPVFIAISGETVGGITYANGFYAY